MTYAERIGVYLTRVISKWLYHPRFGKFLYLENIKHSIVQAANRKEEAFPDLVVSYISAAFLIPKFILNNTKWEVTLLLFSFASIMSSTKLQIPLLTVHAKEKDKKDSWDYEGRGYAMYVHIIANSYGWTQKQIDNLKIDTALALVQEILTDEQLDREFMWSISDKSYIYNYKTKSGKANPLDRPYFMKEEVKPPVKTKILRNMMPVGNGTYAKTEADLKPAIPPPSAMRGI